jgi:hypothetical protein
VVQLLFILLLGLRELAEVKHILLVVLVVDLLLVVLAAVVGMLQVRVQLQ